MPLFKKSHVGQGQFKYQFSILLHDLTVENSAMPLKSGEQYKLHWKRGQKSADSREYYPKLGDKQAKFTFDESLSMLCTLYRDANKGAQFEEKVATFSLCTTNDKALCKATLNLATYCSVAAVNEEVELKLQKDGKDVGVLKMGVSSRWLKNFQKEQDDDSISLSSLGSAMGGSERDFDGYGSDRSLSGFSDVEDDSSRSDDGKSSRQSKRELKAKALPAGPAGMRVKELEAQVKMLQEAKEAAEKAAEEAVQAREKAVEAHAAERKDLQAGVAEQTKRATDLQDQLAKKTAELDQAEVDSVLSKTELEGAREEAAKSKAKVDELTQQVSVLGAKETALRGQITQMEVHTLDLSEKASELETSLAQERALLGEAQGKLSSLESAQAQLGEDKDASEAQLREQVAAFRGGNKHLKEQVESLSAELQTARAELETERSEKAALDVDLQTAKRELNLLKKEAKAKAEKAEEDAALIKSLQTEVDEAKKATDKTSGDAASIQAQLDEATAQLAQSKEQITTLQAQLDPLVQDTADKDATGKDAGMLVAEGNAANTAGKTDLALLKFEQAYAADQKTAYLLSAANMRLKRGDKDMASALYQWLLRDGAPSEREKEMANRKLTELGVTPASGGGLFGSGGGGAEVAKLKKDFKKLKATKDELSRKVTTLEVKLVESEEAKAELVKKAAGSAAATITAVGSASETVVPDLSRVSSADLRTQLTQLLQDKDKDAEKMTEAFTNAIHELQEQVQQDWQKIQEEKAKSKGLQAEVDKLKAMQDAQPAAKPKSSWFG